MIRITQMLRGVVNPNKTVLYWNTGTKQIETEKTHVSIRLGMRLSGNINYVCVTHIAHEFYGVIISDENKTYYYFFKNNKKVTHCFGHFFVTNPLSLWDLLINNITDKEQLHTSNLKLLDPLVRRFQHELVY